MIPGFSSHAIGLIVPPHDQGFAAIATAGFRSVDLRLLDLAESGIQARSVRKLLKDHGLVAGTCPFPLNWRGPGIGTGELVEKLKPLLDYASDVGIERFYTRVADSLPAGLSVNDVLGDHRRKLKIMGDVLAEYRIGLALETVGVESFRQGRPPLMPTLSRVRRNLSDCFDACPNLGLLVDTFHLHAAGESVVDAVGPFIDRVFGIHVADLPRRVESRSEILDHERELPGRTGQVPVNACLSELRKLGCPQGTPVIVEILKCPGRLAGEPLETITRAVYESLSPCLAS